MANLGRVPEAAECGRRALALARELDYPFGIARATACLVLAALYAGDLDEAARLARQAGQIPDIPGTAGRLCGFLLALMVLSLMLIGEIPAVAHAIRLCQDCPVLDACRTWLHQQPDNSVTGVIAGELHIWTKPACQKPKPDEAA